MAFILAPYNNAMRLGQGFNTYTQQICIDDAVVIDPGRAENVITNDGTTMRIKVQSQGRPSAWSRQKEVVEDDTIKKIADDEGDDTVKAQTNGNLKAAVAPKTITEKTKDAAGDAITDDMKTEKKAEPANGIEDTAVVNTKDAEEDGTPEQPKIEGESKTDTPSAAVGGSKDIVEGKDHSASANATKRPGSSSVGQKTKAGAVITRKTPTKTDKTSKGGVDWDLYRSQETPSAEDEEEKKALLDEEKERVDEENELRKQREQERRAEQAQRRAEARQQREEERAEKRDRLKELKEEEKARQAEAKANIDAATADKFMTKEEKAANQAKYESIKSELDKAFNDRFTGLMENKQDYDFDDDSIGGPSQIVTYTSRFVDKLSDVTDDMNISGSLSIKAGKFGGSGRGSFIDSDKFKQSDLNFYISVSVVNQSINFKDALIYNPVKSVNKENFNAVFGDGFISGFQEGGEFNALVSMKILNKAKKTDIQAEAKVAFTAGTVDLTAEANVNIAKTNIETNTETTIQVSWSGGGHVKPREQQWDIQSLLQAAARFPDLVAECPQRIYAIITKYESLRSFVQRKPEGYTKLQYENAQIYTNTMMDSYMSYKSLYTRLGSDIFDVKSKAKVIKPWEEPVAGAEGADTKQADEAKTTTTVAKSSTGVSTQKGPPIHDTSKYPPTVAGISQAKTAIRKQMALIVNEVDAIEKDPKVATDDDHYEPFQDPNAFEERLPKVEPVEKPKTTIPLSGKRIVAKPQAEVQSEDDAAASADPEELISDKSSLTSDEQSALDKFTTARPAIGTNLRLTPPTGSATEGASFNNLEFLQPEWKVISLKVEIYDGALSALWLSYDNGLILSRGIAKGGRTVEITDFRTGERVISGSIQTGKGPTKSTEDRVIAIQLYTNRGRNLVGQAAACSYDKAKGHTRDGVLYTDVKTHFFDVPLNDGNLKGLYGRAGDDAVWRLGFIWGNLGRDEGHDGTIDSAPALDIMDPITQAMATTTQTQTELKSLKSQLQDYMKDKETLNSQLNDARNSLASRTQEKDSLTSQLNEARASQLSWGNRSSAYREGRIEIHFIIYGGALIWDDNVARRFIGYARNNQEWTMNDESMGRDPWYGTKKSGAVVYRYDNRGEVRCLSARQDDRVRFDPL